MPQPPQRRRLGLVASHLAPAAAGATATVAVSGAAGYVGSWLVKLSLARGWHVRACVRNLDDERKTGFLKAMPEYATGQLTLHAADMSIAGVYDEIFSGCSCVFHPAEVMMTFASTRAILTTT